MNITLAGTKVSMDGHTLAFQKNNLVDSMVITVDTDETWQYKLDVKYPCKDSDGKELYNVIDLTRVGNTCTAILKASMLPFNGKYTMQLRGVSDDKVYHTDTFDVWVKYSIDLSKVYDPVPSEFYQIEYNITSMNNHPPKPGDNGYWLVWNVAKQEYEESDIPLPKGALPEVSDSTNGWYLTNDGERVYWAEVQGDSGEGDIAAIQVNGINQPIVDKVAKLTIGKDTVGLDNLDNVRQYSSVNQPPYPVTSVAGKTGAVTLTKADVGLGNVDNTSDANKPISTATQTALNGKLDKTSVVDVTADAIKGQAADAKSVGDAINRVNSAIEAKQDRLTEHDKQEIVLTGITTAVWGDEEKKAISDKLTIIKNTLDGGIAVAGAQYYLGVRKTVSIVLPDDAGPGDMITVIWYNGDTPATLSITGKMLDFNFVPSANTRSEINALYDGRYWAVLGNEMAVVAE